MKNHPIDLEEYSQPGRYANGPDILQPQRVCASTNTLIHDILDHLYHEGHAYHYVGVGWGITEEGVSVIENGENLPSR